MDIKVFTNNYWDLIKSHGFDLIKVNVKGERFAEFINNKFEVNFRHTIFFMRSGTIDFFLSGQNEIITEIYNNLDGVVKTDELYLISTDLRKFLNPINNNGFSNRAMGTNNSYNFTPIQSEKETNEFAETIYHEVFSKSVPQIIDETNLLQKIDKLFNLNPPVLDEEGDPKIRVHTSSLPDQLLVALLLARCLNRNDFDELLNNYSGFINKFLPGDVLEIDIIKKNFYFKK